MRYLKLHIHFQNVLVAIGLLSCTFAYSQIQCKIGSELEITLTQGSHPNWYYYYPAQLRLATDQEGNPEVSLLKIQDSIGAPIKGILLHLLLQWGLTNEQEKQLDSCLQVQTDSLGIVAGSVLASHVQGYENLQLDGKNKELIALVTNNLKSQGKVPLFPQNKTALSFYFEAEAAKILLEKVPKISPESFILKAVLKLPSGAEQVLSWNFGMFLKQSLQTP